MSTELLKTKLHNGEPIDTVEVVACRYGAVSALEDTKKTDSEKDTTDYKIPFLRLVFSKVHVTAISLALSDDALPTERMTFKYERVEMETVWTDNETGKRVPGGTQRVGWNKEKSDFC